MRDNYIRAANLDTRNDELTRPIRKIGTFAFDDLDGSHNPTEVMPEK